jgi:hypothetical protein
VPVALAAVSVAGLVDAAFGCALGCVVAAAGMSYLDLARPNGPMRWWSKPLTSWASKHPYLAAAISANNWFLPESSRWRRVYDVWCGLFLTSIGALIFVLSAGGWLA